MLPSGQLAAPLLSGSASTRSEWSREFLAGHIISLLFAWGSEDLETPRNVSIGFVQKFAIANFNWLVGLGSGRVA